MAGLVTEPLLRSALNNNTYILFLRSHVRALTCPLSLLFPLRSFPARRAHAVSLGRGRLRLAPPRRLRCMLPSPCWSPGVLCPPLRAGVDGVRARAPS